MFRKSFRLFTCLSVILLFACSASKPLLPQAEIQKLSDEEFRDYFLKRMGDTVIPIALDSGGYRVVKKYVQYGEMRVGSYPRGVDRRSPYFIKCKEEYKVLKTELVRRASGNTGEDYYAKTMKEANKNYELQLEKMWAKIQNVLGAETKTNLSSMLSVDFLDIYENRKAIALSESFGLLDYTFEKYEFKK